MEAVMVNAFSGAMGSLLGKLGTMLAKDFEMAGNAKKDIASLRDEMSSINALLMKLSAMEEPVDVQHRELRSRVRELAYDMEDCVDIFMHGHHKAGFLQEIKKVSGNHQTAKLIRDLKARVAEIGNWCELIAQLPAERPRAVRVDPWIQALYVDAANLQGIDGPKQEILELLKVREDGAQQLKVVSIVGLGGIGKTTLANQVYNTIQGQYECTAFVSVSRNPDLVKILSDIIKQIWFDPDLDDENTLITQLRELLQHKRYLIVIDDIWTTEPWNIIKCCFVDNNQGSRVITTTRIEDTAKACCSSIHDYVYRIKPLNDLDSRRLFHRRIFHSEDACPEQLKCVSNEILKKCGGLPLAILNIGSILCSHQDVCSTEIWEKITSSFRFQLETSPALEWMRHVLNLGYNDLSLDLKTCLLYLGIFPEDYKILKDDLLRRWIAEGFVTDHGYCQEEIAENFFNELINRNMIQIEEFDDCGEVLSCRVHDLILDFIILKSTEENFITIITDDHSTKGPLEVRRLSVCVRSAESNDVLENLALTHARSFNLWRPAQWLPSLKNIRLLRVLHLYIYGSSDRLSLRVRSAEGNDVLQNMALTQARSFNWWGPAHQCLPSLKKFQLLRVLNLDIYGSSDRQQYDLSCIHSLFQLGYLRTRGLRCKELLTQLRNLEQLKTLEVASEEYFSVDARMLPLTLRHLILPVSVEPVGRIGLMRDLSTLCEFKIELQDVERIKGLGELTNLKELALCRERYCTGDSCDVLLSSLCRLCNLRSLVIRGSLDEDVLARWSPPPSYLRRLHVLGCRFSTVPGDWITQLSNLSSLEIRVLSLPSDGAEVLARLTSLVHLTLFVNERAPQEGIVVLRRAAFSNLREFLFRCKTPCLAFEAGAMPRLRSLAVECYADGARQADIVLDGIEHLGSLLEFKADVYVRDGFIRKELGCGYVEKPRVDEHRKWDYKNLEAALTEAISKHPGSLRVVIHAV